MKALYPKLLYILILLSTIQTKGFGQWVFQDNAYTISVNTTTSSNTQFVGGLTVSNGVHWTIGAGDTIIVGTEANYSSVTFYNNAVITIPLGSVFIVYGNLTLLNKSKIHLDGDLVIIGNGKVNNNGVIDGSGSITSLGTITLGNGNTEVFGSGSDCATGPCSYNDYSCTYTNVLSYTGDLLACGNVSGSITGTTNAPSPSYLWEIFDGAGMGWRPAPGMNNLADYNFSITIGTSFRRKLISGSSVCYSNVITITNLNPGIIGSDKVACKNSTVTLNGITDAFGGETGGIYSFSYQWQYLDGSIWRDLSGGTNSASVSVNLNSLYKNKTGDFYVRREAIYTLSFLGIPINLCSGYSNVVTIHVINNTAPAISISASTTICSGTLVTVTASSNMGNTGTYKWKLGGNDVGNGSLLYQSGNLQNNDQIKLIWTRPSGMSCITSSSATSNTLTLTVNTSVTPTVSITNPGNPICVRGAAFSASAVNGGSSPTYAWTVNGTAAGTGEAPNLTGFSVGANTVGVTLTSNASCATSTTASASTSVTASSTVVPTVSIAANPGNIICAGKSVAIDVSSSSNLGTTPSYTWYKDGTSTGITTASYTTSSLTEGDQIQLKVIPSSEICSSLPSVSSATIDFSVVSGSWLGTTSAAWSTNSNWCLTTLPNASSDVIIGDLPPSAHYPVLDVPASVHNLSIKPGASLTIAGANSLTLKGNWANEGAFTANNSSVIFEGGISQTIAGDNTFNNLSINNNTGVTIASGAGNTQTVNGKIALHGKLISNDNLVLDLTNGGMIVGPSTASGIDTLIGNITVERTLTASTLPSWHYISTPLGAGKVADYNDNLSYITAGIGNYYYYNEAIKSADKNVGFKPYYGSTGSFGGSALKGIAIYQRTSPAVFDITGTYAHYLAYKDVPLGFTPYTSTGFDLSISQTSDGWHLIGNPYPSPIDWEVVLSKSTNLSGTVYFYNNDLEKIAYYNNGIDMGTDGSEIPAMQSFFVQTTTPGGTITIDPSCRISSASNSLYRKTAQPVLRFAISNGAYNDEAVIRFLPEGTDSYNLLYDAIKFENGGKNPALYTSLGKVDYAIKTLSDAVNSDKKVPMYFKPSFNGTYTLKLSGLETIDPALEIYLEDTKSGVFYNLRMESTLSVEAATTDKEDRFVLLFSEATVTSFSGLNAEASPIQISSREKAIGVEFINPGSAYADIQVTDVIGRKIGQIENAATSGGIILISVQKQGVYVVKVASKNKIVVKKLFISGE